LGAASAVARIFLPFCLFGRFGFFFFFRDLHLDFPGVPHPWPSKVKEAAPLCSSARFRDLPLTAFDCFLVGGHPPRNPFGFHFSLLLEQGKLFPGRLEAGFALNIGYLFSFRCPLFFCSPLNLFILFLCFRITFHV